jgi:DNA-binding NtrC family response regulator
LFEAADGGTLFLDEIGSLSPAVQAKLLTAVEEHTIRRVGSTRELVVDVRLIAASNRPLATLVADGAFRDDLQQRLNLLRLTLPPLRERGTDVVELAHHLLARIAARHRLPDLHITRDGEARLLAQPWHGNVRELAHELERAVIFGSSSALDFAYLGSPAVPAGGSPSWRNPAWRLPESGFSVDQVIEELIADALRETNNNVSAAARRLGVTREFLRYRLHPDKRSGAAAPEPTST